MPPERDGELLKEDLGGMITTLKLGDLREHFLRSRWLDQVLWMEGRAAHSRERYYALRLTMIVGGVIVPALLGLGLPVLRYVTIGLSLLVAVSAAVEEFFHYGERWRHYRRATERLKAEGWHFFQLSGPYRDRETHAEAFRDFAARVEDIIQRDVDVYVTEVVREKKEKGGRGEDR